uniref:Uncharacterized protein n=1 Tax=Clastoptera arizonana TaxID=38151 RepID=A0A1B6DNS7_9HEMI
MKMKFSNFTRYTIYKICLCTLFFIEAESKIQAPIKTSLPEVCSQLRILDEELVDLIKEISETDKEYLLNTLTLCNEVTAKFVHYLAYEKEDAIAIGQDLIEAKIPSSLKLEVNCELLKKHDWLDADCNKFKDLKKKLLDKWDMVRLFTEII